MNITAAMKLALGTIHIMVATKQRLGTIHIMVATKQKLGTIICGKIIPNCCFVAKTILNARFVAANRSQPPICRSSVVHRSQCPIYRSSVVHHSHLLICRGRYGTSPACKRSAAAASAEWWGPLTILGKKSHILYRWWDELPEQNA